MTAALSPDKSGHRKARVGVHALAAQSDGPPPSLRMTGRTGTAGLANARPACAAADGQGAFAWTCPAGGRSPPGAFIRLRRGLLAGCGPFHRACGRQSAASGASHFPVRLQSRHFQAHPAANARLPQFESLWQAPPGRPGGRRARGNGGAGQGRPRHRGRNQSVGAAERAPRGASPPCAAADQSSRTWRRSASTRGRSRLVCTKRRISTGSVCASYTST